MFTHAQVLAVVGRRSRSAAKQDEIITQLIALLPVYGAMIDILQLHRLCDWLAQCAHESAHFSTTVEFNGARARYAPWFGRGLIQLTWLANYQAFVRWLWKVVDKALPDYSTAAHRDKVAQFPTAFLTAIFYWQWKKLNRFSDNNDYLGQTKKINGGTNGLTDRIKLQGRFGLMLLGYKIEKFAYKNFQRDHNLPLTDKYDKATQKAMRAALKAAPPITTEKPKSKETLMEKIIKLLTGKTAQGGILGALLTALGMGAVGAEGAPVGDIANLDISAIIAAVVAAIMGAKNVKDEVTETDVVVPIPAVVDGDTTIDTEEVSGLIKSIMSGETIDDDADEYAEVVTDVMGGGLSNVNDALVVGIKFGSVLRQRAEDLKAAGAPEE